MRRLWVVAAAVVLAAAVAMAQEQQDPARWTIDDAVDALVAGDRDRRRQAVDALAARKPEDLAEILTEADGYVDDPAVWSGLFEALERWEGTSAEDGLLRLRPAWPGDAHRQLDRLVRALRAAKDPDPLPDLGATPPEILAAIDAVLSRYDADAAYVEPNPDAAELAKLGRAAMPALLAFLRDDRPDLDAPESRARVVADALAFLAYERDLPAIGLLIAHDRTAAARVLGRLPSPAALDALLGAIERDVVDDEVLDALEAQDPDPRVERTVLAWLKRSHRDVGAPRAAEFLARRHRTEAAESVRSAMWFNSHPRTRARLAASLAALGDHEGVRQLVESAHAWRNPSAQRIAGEALNVVVGRRVLRVEPGPEQGPPRGNFDEAAAEFQQWWDANHEALVFNPAGWRWRVEGGDRLALPPSPLEVRMHVRVTLRLFDSTDATAAPEVDKIVDLGRDAVPELFAVVAESDGTAPSRQVWSASAALVRLVTEEDLPILARLLARGRLTLVPCIARFHSDAARDALLGAVRYGFVDDGVVDALRPYADHVDVGSALVWWLATRGATSPVVGRVAELLAQHDREDALDPLRKLLARHPSEPAKRAIAEAAALLGGVDGIEALLAMASSESPHAADAAAALERILGPLMAEGEPVAEASSRLHAWWAENSERVVFDPVARRWSLRR